MASDSQGELFGAPMGEITRSTIEVHRGDDGQWVVSLVVETLMRKDPMRVRVYLHDGEGIDTIVGAFAGIVLKTYYCGASTIKAKMLAILESLKASGYEAVGFKLGSERIRKH